MSTKIDFTDFNSVNSNYLEVTYPSATQEVYTYRKDGASDPIVLQLTVNYTDATKASISSVIRNTPSPKG